MTMCSCKVPTFNCCECLTFATKVQWKQIVTHGSSGSSLDFKSPIDINGVSRPYSSRATILNGSFMSLWENSKVVFSEKICVLH